MSKYKAQMAYAKRKQIVKIGFDDRKEIREKFKELCTKEGKKYSRVIKEYVYKYIEEREGNKK